MSLSKFVMSWYLWVWYWNTGSIQLCGFQIRMGLILKTGLSSFVASGYAWMDLTLDGSDLVLSNLLVFFLYKDEAGTWNWFCPVFASRICRKLGTDKKGQVKTIIKIYLQYPYFTCQILASVKLFFNSGDQKYMNIMMTIPNIFFVHLL
jgi:hypothetical protein